MKASSSKGRIISATYRGMEFHFTRDAWFNATGAAARFKKDPHDWLRQRDTVEYVLALFEYLFGNSGFLPELNEINKLDGQSAASRAKLLRLVKKTGLVKTKAGSPETGGGTWFHPKLAVAFARWLDVGFAIWCDMQIDSLIRPSQNWNKTRMQAATTYKCMNEVLTRKRKEEGKESLHHHFSNEAKLINFAMTGEFSSVDRDSLPVSEIELIVHLEEQNIILIGMGKPYEERKVDLVAEALSWREKRSMPAHQTH